MDTTAVDGLVISCLNVLGTLGVEYKIAEIDQWITVVDKTSGRPTEPVIICSEERADNCPH